MQNDMRTILITSIALVALVCSCTNSESNSDRIEGLDNLSLDSSVLPSDNEEINTPEISEEEIFLQSLSPSNKESLEREIAKFAVCALYFKESSEVFVQKRGGGYIAGYRNGDGIKRNTKIEIEGNTIKWGNSDGRWRTHLEDEKVYYSLKEGSVIIEVKYADGSSSVETYKSNLVKF